MFKYNEYTSIFLPNLWHILPSGVKSFESIFKRLDL
jgi:hypothetical protein